MPDLENLGKQALKSGLANTSHKAKAPVTKATLTGSEPQLLVADIKLSCQFFCEQLGFSLVFSYGSPAYYAQGLAIRRV